MANQTQINAGDESREKQRKVPLQKNGGLTEWMEEGNA